MVHMSSYVRRAMSYSSHQISELTPMISLRGSYELQSDAYDFIRDAYDFIRGSNDFMRDAYDFIRDAYDAHTWCLRFHMCLI